MNSVILVVEDDPSDEKLMLRTFRRSGVANDVVIVRDGAEALDYLFGAGNYAARETSILPAVVLLDLRLPKIPGIEVLRRIRAHERTSRLPVVVFTSSVQDEAVVRGYALDANASIRKPLDFGEFVNATSDAGALLGHPPRAASPLEELLTRPRGAKMR